MKVSVTVLRLLCCLLACAVALPGGLAGASAAAAAEPRTLTLPKPETQGGMPLMEALARRASARKFSDRNLSEQQLSNLLWAAWGVNRPDGKRTVPTAMNKQKLLVFVALDSGVWQYNPKEHTLTLVLDRDMRNTYKAPVTLLLAAPDDDEFAGMHVGSVYQNVGLFCASEGLNNVVKATGRDALENQLPLPDDYRVQIIHSLGLPPQ